MGFLLLFLFLVFPSLPSSFPFFLLVCLTVGSLGGIRTSLGEAKLMHSGKGAATLRNKTPKEKGSLPVRGNL